MTGTGVTGISDDCYRSTIRVIVISLGTRRIAGENLWCTWMCRRTNAEITNKLWEMPVFAWILIRKTLGIIWDSPDVHKQLISLNSEYDTSIFGQYQFWIILATIFFNTVFITSLHYDTKERGNWLRPKCRYTETTTRQNSQKISITDGVDVIYYFSHFIKANESRNT